MKLMAHGGDQLTNNTGAPERVTDELSETLERIREQIWALNADGQTRHGNEPLSDSGSLSLVNRHAYNAGALATQGRLIVITGSNTILECGFRIDPLSGRWGGESFAHLSYEGASVSLGQGYSVVGFPTSNDWAHVRPPYNPDGRSVPAGLVVELTRLASASSDPNVRVACELAVALCPLICEPSAASNEQ